MSDGGKSASMMAIDSKLGEFVKRLLAATAEVECVVLYGSAVRGDFHQGHSDLNILCVLPAIGVKRLQALSPVVQWWTMSEKQPAPLFFTANELRSAADVFAVELLDIQKEHRLLHGTDIFGDLAIPMNLHRVQVEHELRTLMLKLRQQFVLTPNDEKTLKAVLAKSHSGTLTLLRHTLLALGRTPPASAREVFAEVAEATGANAEALAAGLDLREKGALAGNLNRSYDGFLVALGKVIDALDQHVPKKEWRRIAGANS
jgi:predicted nucleotidyltransferase